MRSVLLALALAAPAHAQEVDVEGRLSVELNAARTEAGGCTLSFLAINGLGQGIDALVFEAVLFDAEGQVDRLMLFDFGALPVGRPRVRQFVVPQTDCDGLGRVLLNGAAVCEGPAATACGEALFTATRARIELLG